MNCFKMMSVLLVLLGTSTPASALLINYNSNNGSGLSGSADFTRVDATHITILLTNTSASNNSQNGNANSVLSSLNFDLGAGVDIAGGSAVIGSGSQYVKSTAGTAWSVQSTPSDFNHIWGYKNDGLGQPSPPISGADNITSYRGTGGALNLFDGGTQNGGTLDNGLVANGTLDIGNNRFFIQNSILISLTLTAAIADLSFLTRGSYIEFGSDFLFVPGTPDENEPEEPTIPEPATLILLGLGMSAMGMVSRRNAQRG